MEKAQHRLAALEREKEALQGTTSPTASQAASTAAPNKLVEESLRNELQNQVCSCMLLLLQLHVQTVLCKYLCVMCILAHWSEMPPSSKHIVLQHVISADGLPEAIERPDAAGSIHIRGSAI